MGLVQPLLESYFTVEDIMKDLRILQEFLLPTRRFLEIIAEDGYLVQGVEDLNKFQVIINE